MRSYQELKEQHCKQLEEFLYKQLDITEEERLSWEQDRYAIDSQFANHFWGTVKNANSVCILGDYDVDGVCATYILGKTIQEICPETALTMRIPKRFSEGYGISEKLVCELEDTLPKGSLIITVDNGIASAALIDRLQKDGFSVIVTDHHEAKGELPKVELICNPTVKELPNPLPCRGWCGAAVAYKLCEAILPPSALQKQLETYAGLATVADCMPLREGNWGLVRRALKHIQEGEGPRALYQLLDRVKQSYQVCNEETFGFYLGPAINAPGRLEDTGAGEVLEYLFSEAEELADWIIEKNEERKTLKEKESELVCRYIEEHKLEHNEPIWVAMEGLHEGILGILAGVVAEKYGHSAIVLSPLEGNPEVYKGSARAGEGKNIFTYLTSVAPFLLKWGGHPGAAGLSIEKKHLREVYGCVTVEEEREKKQQKKEPIFQISKWEIPKLSSILQKFAPYGEGNPKPHFSLPISVKKDKVSYFGKKGAPKLHLSMDGIIQDKPILKVLQFYHFLMPENGEEKGISQLRNEEEFLLKGTITKSVNVDYKTKTASILPTFQGEEAVDMESLDTESLDME